MKTITKQYDFNNYSFLKAIGACEDDIMTENDVKIHVKDEISKLIFALKYKTDDELVNSYFDGTIKSHIRILINISYRSIELAQYSDTELTDELLASIYVNFLKQLIEYFYPDEKIDSEVMYSILMGIINKINN
jgi:hypothetical protein